MLKMQKSIDTTLQSREKTQYIRLVVGFIHSHKKESEVI